MGVVARRHEPLQVMTGVEFVKHDGARKVRIVATQAHELLLVGHVRGGI